MSSILEALRELEGSRPRPGELQTRIAEAPSAAPPRTGAVVAVAGGLAVGVLAVGIYAWTSGGLVAPRVDAGAPAGEAARPAATADRPSWLDTAEAPRARLDAGTPPAPERATARRAPTATEPAPAAMRAEPRAGRVEVESITYAQNPAERSATLLLDGRRVTLHQSESAQGVVVQLIMPDGVYVGRGSEVTLVEPGR